MGAAASMGTASTASADSTAIPSAALELSAAFADEMTTDHDFPLTVPGENDVQCWELRGGNDGHLKATQPVPLPAEYTIAAWLRIDEGTTKMTTVLAGGDSKALVINDKGQPGIVLGDKDTALFVDVANAATVSQGAWCLVACTGKSKGVASAPHLGVTSFHVGCSSSDTLLLMGSVGVCASGYDMRTIGAANGTLGCLAELCVWPTALDDSQLATYFKITTAVLPAKSGGVVRDLKTGFALSVPADAFLLDGEPFAGEAVVGIAVIDAADPEAVACMPGNFAASDVTGRAVQLRTFGAMHVELKDASTGAALGVDPACGKLEATWPCTVPCDDLLAKCSAPPCAWYFEEEAQVWVPAHDAAVSLGDALLPSHGEIGAPMMGHSLLVKVWRFDKSVEITVEPHETTVHEVKSKAAKLFWPEKAARKAAVEGNLGKKKNTGPLFRLFVGRGSDVLLSEDHLQRAKPGEPVEAELADRHTSSEAATLAGQLAAKDQRSNALKGARLDEGATAWSVAAFKELFSSAQGQEFKMKIGAGGFWNLDSPYLACLVTGTVPAAATEAAVGGGEEKTAAKSSLLDLDQNEGPDLFHQGGGRMTIAKGGYTAVAIGKDYSGTSKARIDALTGVFEVICQLNSSVNLEIVDPGQTRKKRFGPFRTAGLGETVDVGTLD